MLLEVFHRLALRPIVRELLKVAEPALTLLPVDHLRGAHAHISPLTACVQPTAQDSTDPCRRQQRPSDSRPTAQDDRRVDEVSTADILAVLNPVWTTKPELGRKLRQRLSMAFKWAVAANHIATNPAGDALAGVLPRHAGNGGHFDSLPASEVPAALRAINASGAFWSTKAAIRMLALTATRSSEVRGMRWDEIDCNVWTIPADRTKTAKPCGCRRHPRRWPCWSRPAASATTASTLPSLATTGRACLRAQDRYTRMISFARCEYSLCFWSAWPR